MKNTTFRTSKFQVLLCWTKVANQINFRTWIINWRKTSFKKCTRTMVPIPRRASSCLALALSILLSILAHLSSSLSWGFFFFSGSHPNSISYQVTNALSVSCCLLFLTTLFFSSCSFSVLLLALSFSCLILSLSFLCSSVYCLNLLEWKYHYNGLTS